MNNMEKTVVNNEEKLVDSSSKIDVDGLEITSNVNHSLNYPTSLPEPETSDSLNKIIDYKSLLTDCNAVNNSLVGKLNVFTAPENLSANEDPIRPKSSDSDSEMMSTDNNSLRDKHIDCDFDSEGNTLNNLLGDDIVDTSSVIYMNNMEKTVVNNEEKLVDSSSKIDVDGLGITSSVNHSLNYQTSLPEPETSDSLNKTIDYKSLLTDCNDVNNSLVGKLNVFTAPENSSANEDPIRPKSNVEKENGEVNEPHQCCSNFKIAEMMITSDPEIMITSDPERMIASDPERMIASDPEIMITSDPEIMITSDNNIYRQQEEICLTSDSEDDSSSLSVASGISSDEAEEEPKEVEIIKLPRKKPNKKKNKDSFADEIILPPIEDLQISIKEEEAKVIGSIYQIVDNQVVVQAYPDIPPIDIDSILFLDCGKCALGKVFDVFGNVQEPLYVVRFNSAEHMKERGIEKGIKVYFAPQSNQHTSYVIMEALLREKGSDASWKDNMEPPQNLIEYSDDEEERMVKNRKKMNKMIQKGNMDTSVDLWKKPEPDSSAKKIRTDNYNNSSRPQHSGQFNRHQNFQNRSNHCHPRHNSQGLFRSQSQFTSRPTNQFMFGGPPKFVSPSPSPFSMPPPSPVQDRAPPSQSPVYNIPVHHSTPGPLQSWMGRNAQSLNCTPPPPPSSPRSPFYINGPRNSGMQSPVSFSHNQPTPMSHSGQSVYNHNTPELPADLFQQELSPSPTTFGSGPAQSPYSSHCSQSYTSVHQDTQTQRTLIHTSGPPPPVYKLDHFPQSHMSGPPPQSHMSGPPSQSHMSGPPPQSHMSGPPSQSHMSGPPSQSHMSGPPPQSHMSGPPSQSHMSGPPPQSHMSGPPQQSNMSGPPPQLHMSGPPPQSHMPGPPPQSHMPGPPPQSHMSGPPPQSHISGPPPQSHMSGPPPQSHMSGPPPQSHMSAPPPQSHMPAPPHMPGPPIQSHMPGPPIQSHMPGPPPESHIPGPLPQLHIPGALPQSHIHTGPPQSRMLGPPPQSRMLGPPPQSHMPGPPTHPHIPGPSTQSQSIIPYPPPPSHMQGPSAPHASIPESHLYQQGGSTNDGPYLRSPPNHSSFSHGHQQQSGSNQRHPTGRQFNDSHSSEFNSNKFSSMHNGNHNSHPNYFSNRAPE